MRRDPARDGCIPHRPAENVCGIVQDRTHAQSALRTSSPVDPPSIILPVSLTTINPPGPYVYRSGSECVSLTRMMTVLKKACPVPLPFKSIPPVPINSQIRVGSDPKEGRENDKP